MARNAVSILTPATLRLLDGRVRTAPRPLAFGQPLVTDRYILTLHPAGHMLGSAQALVESHVDGERILYTGDFKCWPSPVAEPLEPVPCDTLIMESTYGSPRFKFPEESAALEHGRATLCRWLDEGCTPVVLGYRLGKAQEILHHLLSMGFQVAAEHGVYEAARAYEELGVRFPGCYRQFDGSPREGEVLLFPPFMKRDGCLDAVPRRKLLMFTGWAMWRSVAGRYGVDEALPLSDHSDFPRLVEYVKRVGAKRVYTVHGFADLAGYLCKLGIPARHLDGKTSETQMRMM